ncbi:anti-sigma factor RsiW [Streptomyces olivoverticillatus]|uniref:Anti-sigma factor RsiW n=1 Tax=Streptomyces olivoverticillatus TaxID=66427 RepID=A0A7W7LSI9_9ACTN|nr:anti-sigma factor RsiW [Streptomyces olivoverticillatus]
MHCSEFRTAISARVDGEALPPGIPGAALDAHLRECPACRDWGERARRLKVLAAGLGLGAVGDAGGGFGLGVVGDVGGGSGLG